VRLSEPLKRQIRAFRPYSLRVVHGKPQQSQPILDGLCIGGDIRVQQNSVAANCRGKRLGRHRHSGNGHIFRRSVDAANCERCFGGLRARQRGRSDLLNCRNRFAAFCGPLTYAVPRTVTTTPKTISLTTSPNAARLSCDFAQLAQRVRGPSLVALVTDARRFP
jgi:hypothetical protein